MMLIRPRPAACKPTDKRKLACGPLLLLWGRRTDNAVKNRYMAICKKVDRGKDKSKSTPRRYSRAETVSRGSSALSTPVGASCWLYTVRCDPFPVPCSLCSASALVAAMKIRSPFALTSRM